MKFVTRSITSLVVLMLVSMLFVAGNVSALDWTYAYDAYNDASTTWEYEVYRIGYAIDEDYLYFNILSGLPQAGRDKVQVGDLYINVGGSHLAGYTGTGYNATYKSGQVYGLALTSHSGDMNADLTPTNSAYKSGNYDNNYDWSAVTQGHLYSNAMFSTGVYEGYETSSYWKQSKNNDGGNDPFGGANNAPSHIAEFGADLGFQGNVTWNYLGSTWVDQANKVKKNAYLTEGRISLDALGISGGETFEMWWSMECGNDFAMASGKMPGAVATPEPGMLLLLGLGFIGMLGMVRKQRA